MTQRIVLTFTSPDRPGIVEELTSVVVQHGGNWEESRSTRLAGEFAGLALVSAPEANIEALCEELARLSQNNIRVSTQTTAIESEQLVGQVMSLTCEGADHEGIVRPLTSALSNLNINVDEMATSIKPAPTTGTPLFHLECQLRIPSNCDVSRLEERLSVLESQLDVQIELNPAD